MLAAIKKDKEGKKVMIAAHMDEIGFIVTHVDDQGFIYFHTLGGFDPKNPDRTKGYNSWKKRCYWCYG